MLKSISELGTVLNKIEQRTINGGTDTSCNNKGNWGSYPKACLKTEKAVYDSSLGHCICTANSKY